MKTSVAVAASVAASLSTVGLAAAVASVAGAGPSLAAGPSCLTSSSRSASHPELGVVRWRRGYDAARAEARTTGKPLLVLFNEVPGCSTVQAFAAEVLADDVIADAIETHFVPVFVSNNHSSQGHDTDEVVMKHFGEPTWNNPVVRMMDPDEHPLVPRIEGAHLVGHPVAVPLMAAQLEAALLAAEKPVPLWLSARASDAIGAAGDTRPAEVTYAMGCFWEGEVQLGAIDGVTSTEPGFVDGREVVRVRYDAARVGRVVVDDLARARGYSAVKGAFRSASGDDKKQIQNNALGRLPLGNAQRMHVNSAVGLGQDPGVWLSPRQLQLLNATACDGGPR